MCVHVHVFVSVCLLHMFMFAHVIYMFFGVMSVLLSVSVHTFASLCAFLSVCLSCLCMYTLSCSLQSCWLLWGHADFPEAGAGACFTADWRWSEAARTDVTGEPFSLITVATHPHRLIDFLLGNNKIRNDTVYIYSVSSAWVELHLYSVSPTRVKQCKLTLCHLWNSGLL